jgi:peptidoglycan hydrolase-like protein with peptidoglycan-binding domain
VPGVTDEPIGVVESEPMAVEHALAANGYDPGRVDGVIDGDTRAAIREFQRDRDLAVTGAIDHDTGEELQMSRYSGERAYPGS